jgi:hypothetical protein
MISEMSFNNQVEEMLKMIEPVYQHALEQYCITLVSSN